MQKQRMLLVALLPFIAVASSSYQTVAVPPATTALCSQLSEVAYWSSVAHLSKSGKDRLAQAQAYSLTSNKLCPAIDPRLVDEANKLGVISHGNAGPGNTSLDGAQADGISTAMVVYEMCLAGRLAR